MVREHVKDVRLIRTLGVTFLVAGFFGFGIALSYVKTCESPHHPSHLPQAAPESCRFFAFEHGFGFSKKQKHGL